MNQNVSIVIRCKNEEKTIARTIQSIWDQTIKPQEIIVVDNNSSDKTVGIARKLGCRIVSINPSPFTHAFSCNEGAKHAKGDFIVFTNAHSLPISNTWLADGVAHFDGPKVAGIFGHQLPSKDSHWLRRCMDALFLGVFGKNKLKNHTRINYFSGAGLMSTVNAIIRKDLWEKHHFDEKLSAYGGGEDTEWAYYFLRKGYAIIEDPAFSVFHSHTETFVSVLKRQWTYSLMWCRVIKKYAFN